MRRDRHALLVGLITMILAVPAHAFHGGGGGFHGGGVGGFHGGVGAYPRGTVGGPAGGFRPATVLGPGGFRGGYAGGAFNRTPSFTMPRTNTTNINNVNAFNNVNRVANINNTNVNRMGLGWSNPYVGYHHGWNHGYWNGNFGGGWGWRPWAYGGYGLGGYGLGGFGYGLGWGLGLGTGWGLSSWMFGPSLYNWGYSGYYNPYYAGFNTNFPAASEPVVYDYALPINPQVVPTDEAVINEAMTVFDSAREAFKAGDYTKALELVNQALKTTPNDTALHEFRALCLFSLHRYDEAASVLYAVLSVGPGWDWTTLISLYVDPATYTLQLRALEKYCEQHPQSAAARFVLAYHYLTQGHAGAAVRQLKQVNSLQPKDLLTTQLLAQLQYTDQSTAVTEHTPAPAPAPAPAVPATPGLATSARSSETPGNLVGTWTARPSADTTITLTFLDPGHFAWKVNHNGKDQQFTGKSTYDKGVLTLVQEQNSNAMVGNVAWQDPNHFTFKVVGGGPADPGLSFTRAA